MTALKPTPGNILVEIREAFSDVVYADQKYDTKTQGVCIAVADDNLAHLVNKLVYWQKYEDGEHILRDDRTFAFIKTKALQGYEDVEIK